MAITFTTCILKIKKLENSWINLQLILILPITVTCASLSANVLPFELIASHEYAPASDACKLFIVNTPVPFPWFSILHLGSEQTCPQLCLQLMNGLGNPVATHVTVNVCPTTPRILRRGDLKIIGFALILV